MFSKIDSMFGNNVILLLLSVIGSDIDIYARILIWLALEVVVEFLTCIHVSGNMFLTKVRAIVY